jgi:hypothetical protein
MWTGVETKDDHPIILARYGWKHVTLNGKKYLAPATREELAAEMERSGRREPDPERCGIDQWNVCIQATCRATCVPHSSETQPGIKYWYCVCER